jgi:hypothetical protein
MKRFYKYVFGHAFTIFFRSYTIGENYQSKKERTSHNCKPFAEIYFQDMLIFTYEVKYRKGKNNGNADCLFRLPIERFEPSEDNMAEEESFEIKSLSTSSEISLNLQLVAKKTKSDEYF